MLTTTLLTILLGTGVTVTLPEESRVSGAEMQLGDIARIQCEDEAAAARVRELELGYSPAPGYHRTLRQWKLQQDVERAFPDLDVTFEGSTVLRVFPETATIRSGEIEAAAREALSERFESEEVRITVRSKIADLEVPLGEDARTLEVDLQGRRVGAGAWSVPVRVLVDGVQYSTVWAPMQVDIFRELAVLKRDVRAGDEITASDYTIERVLVSATSAQEPIEGELPMGALAARRLAAGSMLRETDLRYALFVEEDAVAKLKIRNGSIEVDVMVLVLEDGRMGDRVRVRPLSGDKEIEAQVVGKNRLSFDLDTAGITTRRVARR